MRHCKVIRLAMMMVIAFTPCLLLSSCGKKESKPPYDLGSKNSEKISIPYEEMGGVKTVPVRLNGVTMNMIYDTGCSGLHLSLHELRTLDKNGKLEPTDIIGTTYATIADGSIVENGLVNIRRLEIGGEDGIILENVQASVALNQQAPILLGNAVLDELASVEVDNINKTINFIKR